MVQEKNLLASKVYYVANLKGVMSWETIAESPEKAMYKAEVEEMELWEVLEHKGWTIETFDGSHYE